MSIRAGHSRKRWDTAASDDHYHNHKKDHDHIYDHDQQRTATVKRFARGERLQGNLRGRILCSTLRQHRQKSKVPQQWQVYGFQFQSIRTSSTTNNSIIQYCTHSPTQNVRSLWLHPIIISFPKSCGRSCIFSKAKTRLRRTYFNYILIFVLSFQMLSEQEEE